MMQEMIEKPQSVPHPGASQWKSDPYSNNFWWQIMSSAILPQGHLRLLAQKITLGGKYSILVDEHYLHLQQTNSLLMRLLVWPPGWSPSAKPKKVLKTTTDSRLNASDRCLHPGIGDDVRPRGSHCVDQWGLPLVAIGQRVTAFPTHHTV